MTPAEIFDLAASLAPLVSLLALTAATFIGWVWCTILISVRLFGVGPGLAWLSLVVILSWRLAYNL